MNNKYYGIIGTIVMGIVLVVLSIILFIYKGQFYMACINFIILLFFLAFIVDLYDMCFRKNKDDKISKEFYYLGKGNIVDIRQDSMANGVPVCEIEYVLDKPVRKDIYDFIMN